MRIVASAGVRDLRLPPSGFVLRGADGGAASGSGNAGRAGRTHKSIIISILFSPTPLYSIDIYRGLCYLT